jgi:hypothetical protein
VPINALNFINILPVPAPPAWSHSNQTTGREDDTAPGARPKGQVRAVVPLAGLLVIVLSRRRWGKRRHLPTTARFGELFDPDQVALSRRERQVTCSKRKAAEIRASPKPGKGWIPQRQLDPAIEKLAAAPLLIGAFGPKSATCWQQ